MLFRRKTRLKGIAQQIIGTVLRETFLHFALQAALVAAMMLLMALLLTALGR